MRALALLLCLLPCLAFGATSNLATTPRDTAALISQTNTPTNGTINLALTFSLAPGWHIYWQNPGDAGLAPQLTLATGTAGPFTYPAPKLLVQGPVGAYVLSGDVVLPFTAQQITGTTIEADANWLICSDICIPEHAHFKLPLTGGPSAQAARFPSSPAIISSPFPATITPDGTMTLTGPGQSTIAAAHFFPFTNGAIINRAPQPLSFTPTGLALKLPTTPSFNPKSPLPGILELTDKSNTTESLAVTPTYTLMAGLDPDIHAFLPPLITTLAFAFLGGLILNLMPCVFPILAMKSLAIIRLGGQAGPKIRAESFAYTAGILTAMFLLAATLLTLRAAGIEAGWGFQFQSPIFVACIAWLIFCAGLAFAGVFTINGLSNLGARLAERHSFFTGLLAVIVATPCTAPFMGAAIAAALAAPPLTALLIFLTLGLGLAAPFVLLACLPGMAKRLPRPGSWMILLQRALSIPMFATFIWLAWVLKFQTGFLGVTLLALGGLALYLAAAQRRLRPIALAALLILPFMHPTQNTAPLTLPGAEPYSPARLAALTAANQPVLIDMTAAWCVTCLVNDRTTLQSAQVQSTLTAHHVRILVGDWTNRNPAITAYLAQNHRAGVPLYVYLAPDTQPKILPQILTPDILDSAIN